MILGNVVFAFEEAKVDAELRKDDPAYLPKEKNASSRPTRLRRL